MSWLLLVLVLFLGGCGSGRSRPDRPAVAPAQGIVTYRGIPVDQAVIVFQPNDPPHIAASAFTDSEGKFELQAFPPEPGAVPGTYSVMILKASQEDVYSGGTGKAATVTPVSLIPLKYSSPAKSGLTHVVVPQSGTQTLVFELRD